MTFTFSELHPLLQNSLALVGYDKPTPIQEAAIPVVLASRDVMAGAQTGTGKTAAFALPLLHSLLAQENRKSGIKALVLTPTRELAQQVHQQFELFAQETDIKAAVAYGGVSIRPQVAALEAGAEILVATPGRLLDHLINGSLTLDSLQTIVFDEADRMLDLGFKDEINRILVKLPAQRQTLLFSATFDDALFTLSKSLLHEPELIEVSERNTVSTQVEQKVYTVDADRKRELTSFLIGSKNWHQVLIFTRTKQTADALAKELIKDGIKASSIHGDKSQGARDKALAEFKAGTIRALVATDVAARGIDILSLSYVINYELPYIAEDYIHRIGRTGRAENNGLAISLMSPDEEWLLTAVEKVLDTRLLQEWLPGYEPDPAKVTAKKSKPVSKKRARDQALGNDRAKKRRRR